MHHILEIPEKVEESRNESRLYVACRDRGNSEAEDGGGHGGIVHHSDYPIPARVSAAYTLGTFARLIAVGTS
jgi:hypothetical protein